MSAEEGTRPNRGLRANPNRRKAQMRPSNIREHGDLRGKTVDALLHQRGLPLGRIRGRRDPPYASRFKSLDGPCGAALPGDLGFYPGHVVGLQPEVLGQGLERATFALGYRRIR